MGQVSCGKFHPFTPVIDFVRKGLKAEAKFRIRGGFWGDDDRQARTKDAGVDAGEEECRPEPEVGHPVSMGLRDALDESVQPQPAEVVGHPTRANRLDRNTQQRSESRAEVGVRKPARQQREEQQYVQQRLHQWICEAERRGSLAVDLDRLLDLVEGIFTEVAIVADALDVQKTSVGSKADLPKRREVLQSLANVEVTRVVDG